MKPHDEVNAHYWAFIYLITQRPEVYLSRRGRVLQCLAEKGSVESMTELAKYLGVENWVAGQICKDLQGGNHIMIQRVGNKKVIVFSEKAVKGGESLIKGMR